jgi:ParB-like nuclease domain
MTEPIEEASEEFSWKGSPDLVPLLVLIDSLDPDIRNARRHGERNLDSIVRSLREFGQLKPVVARGRRILAGNGTWTAAQALGWNALAAVQVPQAMSDGEALAYAVADNQTALLAEWDEKELGALFQDLPGELHALTGFTAAEVGELPGMESPDAEEEEDGERPKLVPFFATQDQATIIRGALAKIRMDLEGEGPDVSDGRALELVCADYLAGA